MYTLLINSHAYILNQLIVIHISLVYTEKEFLSLPSKSIHLLLYSLQHYLLKHSSSSSSDINNTDLNTNPPLANKEDTDTVIDKQSLPSKKRAKKSTATTTVNSTNKKGHNSDDLIIQTYIHKQKTLLLTAILLLKLYIYTYNYGHNTTTNTTTNTNTNNTVYTIIQSILSYDCIEAAVSLLVRFMKDARLFLGTLGKSGSGHGRPNTNLTAAAAGTASESSSSSSSSSSSNKLFKATVCISYVVCVY